VGRAPIPHFIALVCGLLTALAVGCGDRSNLIPATSASGLTEQLAEIQSAIDAGQCDGLADRVKAFHDDATNLSNAVDKRLRQRINEGARSLQATALTDCQSTQAAQTAATTTVDTTTTETVATDTTTVDTTTATVPADTTTVDTPTDTTPPATTPTTTEPPTTTQDPGSGPAPDNGGTSPELEPTP
jgi:hypothetical protein